VPPGEFVPLAERTGLAPRLDRWVLRAACGAAVAWPRPWAVSVNISAITFGHAAVAEMVRDALAETGLPPGRLVVEMTETALAADAARAGREVEALRALGVEVALDDLGAGHASLLALRRYPFTKVKVDRGLVSGLDADPVGARTVGFIGELGALLGIAVVAEGVERAAELREVKARGVALAQGFFLARPAAAGGVAEAACAAETRSRTAFTPEMPAR
jgi:EAL domain-containing protein (putative c-di-GMP-specific phosphodiesterase class I)